MKRIAVSVFVFILLLLALPAGICQQKTERKPLIKWPAVEWNKDWGIGIKAGLNGIGFDAVKKITDKVNVRLGYSFLRIPYKTVQSLEGYNLDVNAHVTLGGANLLADYYPWKRIFHFTGGLVFNQTLVTVDVKSLNSFPYGDIEIPAGDVGSLTGRLAPGIRISPYIAAGAGYTFPKLHKWSWNIELGTFFQGRPKIALSGTGVIGPMASENNTLVINNAIAQYGWFPMLNFLVVYRIR